MTSSSPEKQTQNNPENTTPKTEYVLVPELLAIENRESDEKRQLRFEEIDERDGRRVIVRPSLKKGKDTELANIYFDPNGRVKGRTDGNYGIFAIDSEQSVVEVSSEAIQLDPESTVYITTADIADRIRAEAEAHGGKLGNYVSKKGNQDFDILMASNDIVGRGDVLKIDLDEAIVDSSEVEFTEKIDEPSSKSNGERAKQERDKKRAAKEAAVVPQTAPTETLPRSTREAPWANAETEELPAQNEEQVEADKALDMSRTALATLAAKRQGHLFGKGGDKYEKIHDQYTEDLRRRGKLRIQEVEANLGDKTDDEKAVELDKAVAAFLAEEQEKLRSESVEQLNGTKVGWFVDKLTSGSRKAQFAKAMGVGFLGVGIGLAAGAAAGATLGAGLAAGAVIGVRGVVRTATGYAKNDAKLGRGLDQDISDDDKIAASQEIADGDDRLESGLNYFNSRFEEDINNEQSKRRKSAARGLGGAAVGAVLGAGAVMLIDHINDADIFNGDKAGAEPIPDFGDWNEGWEERDKGGDTMVNDPLHNNPNFEGGGVSQTDVPLDQQEAWERQQAENGGSGADLANAVETDGGPDAETATPEANPTTPEVSVAGEFNVEAGHGLTHELIQTFANHGATLSPQEAYQLHMQLVDQYGSDYISKDVYSMGASPYEVGIASPGATEWNPAAAAFIEQAIEAKLSGETPELNNGLIDSPTGAGPEAGSVDVQPAPEVAESAPSASAEQAPSIPEGYQDLTSQEIADKLREQTADVRLSAEQVEAALSSDLVADRLVSEGLAERTDEGLALKVDDNGNLSRDLVQYIEDNADRIESARRLNGLLG